MECVLLRAGFEFARQTGSHRHYVKPGIIRPVVVPAHNKPVQVFVIQNNLRTAGLSRADFFRLLSDC